ncbi:MAG: diguanylate cyclase (GGDEF)-like protein [Patiriisocius sp.]|jgi:diguanylate cyclase (GGDEF)-like protein
MQNNACRVEEYREDASFIKIDKRHVRLKNSTIMLVDDEPVMLEIVQALLEEVGYDHFISIEDSTKAIDVLISESPDILLLDLDMPEVDGFQVLQEIRTLEGYEHLPVIILTASEDPDSKLKALELGATDFLSKPVDPSELALRVRNTLSAKDYQDQLAYYDSLTGLPNRKLFLDYLDKGIKQAKRDGRSLVLLEIGLDRFQQVNESLGVYLGDQILQIIANRLMTVVRDSDIVGRSDASALMENTARIGGDEFSIIVHGVDSVANASGVNVRVLEAIREPIHLDGNDVYLTASIGVAVYPEDGCEVGTLFKRAGSAKDFAKKQGRDRFQYYSTEIEAHSRVLLRMATDLRAALEQKQFQLHYQPQIDLNSGCLMGMECLIRWIHPEYGSISPQKFIPIAEELGLIVPIGDWVLHEACRRASEWNAARHNKLKVSVNVSASQFLDSEFKAKIISNLQSSGLEPSCLVLEITESMLMGDVEQLATLLHEIKSIGVSFSLDDFGTGYSSLSYLKKFPIHELKIDRSFLLEVPANNDDNSLVVAIIAMAHSLGQIVVAEGVEKIEQVKFLKQHNCDVIQGFYFSKPLNRDDFDEYLAVAQ